MTVDSCQITAINSNTVIYTWSWTS